MKFSVQFSALNQNHTHHNTNFYADFHSDIQLYMKFKIPYLDYLLFAMFFLFYFCFDPIHFRTHSM